MSYFFLCTYLLVNSCSNSDFCVYFSRNIIRMHLFLIGIFIYCGIEIRRRLLTSYVHFYMVLVGVLYFTCFINENQGVKHKLKYYKLLTLTYFWWSVFLFKCVRCDVQAIVRMFANDFVWIFETWKCKCMRKTTEI